jgi:hypothetical protein
MRAISFAWLLAHLAPLLLGLLLVACTAENSSNGSGGSADGLSATSVPESGSESIPLAAGVAPKQHAPYRQYRTIEWVDLIPEDDLEALLSPPDYLADIVDGSLEDQLPQPGEASLSPNEGNTEDQIAQQIKDAITSASDSRYQQALVSTRIKEEFKDQSIRIPGFIVPLEFDAEYTVTQFFIVPYFGACIHSPPPPPNQTVFATFAQGVNLDLIYDPFWFSGTLTTSITEKETVTSAYSLSVDSIEPYSE